MPFTDSMSALGLNERNGVPAVRGHQIDQNQTTAGTASSRGRATTILRKCAPRFRHSLATSSLSSTTVFPMCCIRGGVFHTRLTLTRVRQKEIHLIFSGCTSRRLSFALSIASGELTGKGLLVEMNCCLELAAYSGAHCVAPRQIGMVRDQIGRCE